MSARARRVGIWVGALAALTAVFVSYLQPDVIVSLANQVWNCF